MEVSPSRIGEQSAVPRQQLVDLGADFVFGKHAGPRIGHLLVGCDQDRDRLIGNAVFLEDVFILIKSPQDVAGRERAQRT